MKRYFSYAILLVFFAGCSNKDDDFFKAEDGRLKLDKTIEDYRGHVSAQRTNATAYLDLGDAYLRRSKLELEFQYQGPGEWGTWYTLASQKSVKSLLYQAIDVLEKGISIDSNSASLRCNLGVAYLRLFQIDPSRVTKDKARESLLRAVELDPSLAEAYISLGMPIRPTFDRFVFEDVLLAARYLEKAVKLSPTNGNAYYWLSMARAARGDYSGAVEALHEALKYGGVDAIVYLDAYSEIDDFSSHLTYGHRFIRGQSDLTETHALDYIPGFIKAYFSSGLENFELHHVDRDMAVSLNALRVNPTFPKAYQSLSEIHYRKSEMQLATKYYLRGKQLNPNIPAPSWIMFSEKPIERQPDAFFAYIDWVSGHFAHLNVQELEKGISYMEEVRRLQPDFAPAYAWRLAEAYWKKGFQEKADSLIQVVLRSEPDNPEICTGIGWRYVEQREFGKAISVLQQAMERGVISKFEGYLKMSTIFSMKQDWDGEISVCQKLLAISPFKDMDIQTYADIGFAYFRKGNYKLGMESFQSAIALDPQSPAPYMDLGFIYAEIGNPPKAVEYYQQAAKLGLESEAQKRIDQLKTQWAQKDHKAK